MCSVKILMLGMGTLAVTVPEPKLNHACGEAHSSMHSLSLHCSERRRCDTFGIAAIGAA